MQRFRQTGFRRNLFLEQLEQRELLAADIVINPGAGLAGNAAALAAFNRAAQLWEMHLEDDVTVNIDADLSNLGNPNVIGQTASVLLQGGYNTIRDQIVNDAADEPDDGIVAALPTAAQASFLLPTGFGVNGNVIATKAALKAAGFTGLDSQFGASDAEITFNSLFSFDFDNTDGVPFNQMDFETVAAHEIGHALGFVSEVDTVDYYKYFNVPVNVGVGVLDLFRFQNGGQDDPADTSQFTSFPRSLEPGQDAVIDQITAIENAAAENRLSTGAYTGDGRQASHWKDNNLTGNLIGMLDPTLSYGQVLPITDADLRALDLIGWDITLGGSIGNQAPVAQDDAAQINKKSGTATGNVLNNDTDPDGDPLTVSIHAEPLAGSVTLDDNGSFVYTPDSTFSGSDTFTYVANDGTDNSNVATVTITAKQGGGGGGGGRNGGGGGRNNRLTFFRGQSLDRARNNSQLTRVAGNGQDMSIAEPTWLVDFADLRQGRRAVDNPATGPHRSDYPAIEENESRQLAAAAVIVPQVGEDRDSLRIASQQPAAADLDCLEAIDNWFADFGARRG
jgi:hypothetical protein